MAAFSFGTQPATQSQPVPFGGFSFGGSTNTTTMPSLSATPFATTSLPAAQVNFGTALTTATPSLFGSTMSSFAPAATSASLFPGFQTTTTSAPSSTGFSFGGFGTTNPSTSALNFGTSIPGVTTVTSTPATVGLGGVDIQSTTGIDGASGTAKKDKAVKETLIPNEIAVVIESFKKYVKEQKVIREEMSRVSSKNIARVQSQVSALKQQLSIASNGLQRNAVTIAKLKQETSEELKNSEIAQRTKDTPPSLQYENSLPSGYFHNLSVSFENQMQSYRQQIELLERHLLSLSQPSTMTPDELTVVVKRLHGAFVTLAAQLQTVHQQVQLQKDQFSAIHKANHSELGSIFETRKRNATNFPMAIYLPTPLSLGPSPVVTKPSTASLALAAVKNRTQQLQANNFCLGMNTLAMGSGFMGGNLLSSSVPSVGSNFNLPNTTAFKPLDQAAMPSFGSTSSLGGGAFSTDSMLSPYGSNNQKPFQLQKPPSGNKRGKRWTST